MSKITLALCLLLASCAPKRPAKPTALKAAVLQSAVADKVTASLAVMSGDKSIPGVNVTLALTATSSQGVITTELWNCENGDLPNGDPPAGGPFAATESDQWATGTLPTGIVCLYSKPGTFKPNVQVFDSLGQKTFTSVTITVATPLTPN